MVEALRASSASSPLLELEQVRKLFRTDFWRPQQVALAGLSCALHTGRCTGLLGHNGAGKTTTIRLILGLLTPTSGRIRLSGKPLSPAGKRLIGYMPESAKLPGSLQVDEVLSHQLHLYAPAHARSAYDRRQLIASTLAAVGLTEHSEKRVAKLSKGMARRLAWAQATIHRPQLLILDEPASGLDPLARRLMLDWMQAEKNRGTTLLLCTHELSQISGLCDDYLVLRRGQLVASGQAADWSSGYALHLSGADAGRLQRLAAQLPLPPWRQIKQQGFATELALADYEAAALWLAALLAQGIVVTKFEADTGSFAEQILQHFAGEG